MNSHLKITLIVVGLLLLLIVFGLIAKKKLPIKFSLFWIFSSIVILIVGMIPQSLLIIKSFTGFETTSNLIIGIIVGILLFITLLLTIIVAEQKRQITLLIQEVSLLNKKHKGE